MRSVQLICIGASAGGIQTLNNLFSLLPKLFEIPIAVAQHIPADSDLNLDLIFGRSFQGRIREATDKAPLEPGFAYFAPPGYHLLVERDRTLSLSQDDPVHFARPSIDVLFESAAWALRENVCGVLLTGANSDGAAGLKEILEVGGVSIAQDPAEAEYPFMPQAAIDLKACSKILNIQGIAKLLTEFSAGVSR